MTYNEAKNDAKLRLTAAGIEDAAIDCGYLLEHLTKKNKSELFLMGNDEMPDSLWQEYVELVERRCNHIPFAYITGEQDFYGRTFKVNENVLVPRQDTEVLVYEALKVLRSGQRILDMCTGSGCILITLLKECEGTLGCGVDLSAKALEVARENASLHGLAAIGEHINQAETAVDENEAATSENEAAAGVNERTMITCEWLHSDLFSNVTGTFDMITANPPYIDTEVIKGLMPEVKDHEPMMALDGGKDGLEPYKPLVWGAFEHLNDEGWFLTEIGYDQGEAVSNMLKDAGFDCVEVIKDLASNDRVVKGKKNVR